MEPRLGKATNKTGRDKLCPYGFEPGSGWDAWTVNQTTVLVISVGADLVSARPQEGKRSWFAMDKDPKSRQGVWLDFGGLPKPLSERSGAKGKHKSAVNL